MEGALDQQRVQELGRLERREGEDVGRDRIGAGRLALLDLTDEGESLLEGGHHEGVWDKVQVRELQAVVLPAAVVELEDLRILDGGKGVQGCLRNLGRVLKYSTVWAAS